MDRAPLFRTLTRKLAVLSLGLLLLATGCVYDDHCNFGATEKWVASDVNYVPKIIGAPILSIVDSIISPFTAWSDQYDFFFLGFDNQHVYHPDHHYLSYSGSRVLGRSDMGDGYKWITSLPSIIIETGWFIITGPVDLITVIFDQDGLAENPPATASAD